MAIIIQSQLFNYKTSNAPSDLSLFLIVLELLHDEALMAALERHRANGRNDYPVRPTWNSLIAGMMFQHSKVSTLICELRRNGELRDACGFNATLGTDGVPSKSAYSRFLKNVSYVTLKQMALIYVRMLVANMLTTKYRITRYLGHPRGEE